MALPTVTARLVDAPRSGLRLGRALQVEGGFE